MTENLEKIENNKQGSSFFSRFSLTNLFNKIFEYSIESKSTSNMEKFYNKKYSSNSMVTKLNSMSSLNTQNLSQEILIDKVDPEFYKKLKTYFFIFNKDAESMSFLSNTYKRFQFDFLRIITEEDLLWLKNKVISQGMNVKFDEKDYEAQITKNFDKIKNEKFFYDPVEWKTFIQAIYEIKFSNSDSNKIDVDSILNLLSEKIKNKKFNFKRYQREYNSTKTNLLLNTFKVGLIFDTRSPDITVIRDTINTNNSKI
jgi:hypothetical protein